MITLLIFAKNANKIILEINMGSVNNALKLRKDVIVIIIYPVFLVFLDIILKVVNVILVLLKIVIRVVIKFAMNVNKDF